MDLSPTEARLQAWIDRHADADELLHLVQLLKSVVLEIGRQGVEPDSIAIALCTHLTGTLSRYKMRGDVDNDLIEMLLDDLIDTVRNRAFLGETKLRTKR